MNVKHLLLAVTILFSVNLHAQQVVDLYQAVPNSRVSDKVKEKIDTVPGGRVIAHYVTVPTLTVFLPSRENANGAAVVICPGGGYGGLVMNAEGTDVAREFVKRGVAAFVLKYRLPNPLIMPDPSIGPLQDAQQAIKLVRERSASWNIDITRVGIIGFSAGGHLASTASTHFNDVVIDNKNGTNLRPDFSILVYPVITFYNDSLVHKGTRKALIGEHFTPAQQERFSNEKQVSAATPTTFIVHSEDDKVVPIGNSLGYYEALVRNGVKGELHIYATGGHGFGLVNKTVTDNWLNSCFNWMTDNKWIKP